MFPPNPPTISRWRQVHYVAGSTLAVFVSVHLLNHLLALAGPAAHVAFMDNVRYVYRHPIVEFLLLSAVAVQVVTGLRLARAGWRSSAGWRRAQMASGLYLAGFFLIHVSAVLMGRYVLHLDTNVYFGAAGLNRFPYLLFFVPYYGGAIVAFFTHVAALHRQKSHHYVAGLSPHRQAQVIVWLGVLVMVATLYGLTAGFRGLPIPPAYSVMTP